MVLRLAHVAWLLAAGLGLAACSEPGPRPPGPGEPTGFPKIVRFAASATRVAAGQTVSLSYKVTDADRVEIAPNVQGPRPVLEGSIETPPIHESTTFTLRAVNARGDTTRALTVTVDTASTAVRIVQFEATPAEIGPGATSTLRWAVVNASSIHIDLEDGSAHAADLSQEGELPVQPAETTTFVLVAEGEGGPVSSPVTVAVGKLPSIDVFEAAPEEINPGEQSVLSWRVSNASQTRILDDQGAALHTDTVEQGVFEVSPSSTTEYTLEALNDLGMVNARVQVRVLGAERPTIERFSVSPGMLTRPGNVTVEWSVVNANTVRLLAGGRVVNDFPAAASGSFQTAVAVSTAFELRASNAFGTTSRQASVVLIGPPDSDAPEIVHTPVVTTQIVGAPIAIEATITDATAGVAGATLHYRVSGATAFDSLPMTLATDRYTATLPGSSVQQPAVEYYLEATDFATPANSARHPLTAPAVLHTFQVTAPDQSPPLVTHTPVADGQTAATSVAITAQISDAESGVSRATIYYRRQGSASFASATLTAGANGEFTGSIPASDVQSPAMEYYLDARDAATPANVATHPPAAPAQLNRFTVTPQDQSSPAISLTPITDGQTAGGALIVSAEIADPSGVARATLHYRQDGAATFTAVAMTAQGTTYSASIPPTAVQAPAVEYYVEATDSAPAANTGRFPALPAAPLRFTVIPLDQQPPQIIHTAIASPRAPGQAVTVTAQVSDASGVASVVLSYRARGATSFITVAMTGGPSYSASIPAGAVEPAGLEYYIRAEDSAAAANAGTTPASAPATTHAFSVGVAEREPNNTTATAGVLLTGTRRTNVGYASIAPSADRDLWAIDVPAGATRFNLRLETTSGSAGLCPSPIATVLRLYAANGTTELISDSFDGAGSCSLIDPETDAAVRALAPGRYYVRVEESGDNATIGSYELSVALTPTQCGNRIPEIPVGEQCDDGNTASGDGCSATCQIEPEGVVVPPLTTFSEDISPAGDVDVFAVDVTQGQIIRAEVTDSGAGCPGDLVAELYAADGMTLIGSDDDGGNGLCPFINPLNDAFARNLGAGRYFLFVRAAGGGVINGYRIRVEVLDGICGNNAVETGEQCDDGDTTSFDGCDASCQWETAGTAMGTGGTFPGAITPVGNIDFYAVVVAQGDSIRAETFVPQNGECATGNDTVLRFYAADRATQIVSDDQDGVGSCSLLDPATDLTLRNLAAGTYYLAVEEYMNNGTIASYVLDVQIRRPGCGNGWLDGGDVCDDGNTANGDGCSSTCQFEGPGEAEPNDTPANATMLLPSGAQASLFGALGSSSDLDVYRVVVPSGYSLWAEINDGRGGCPNQGTLRLRDTDGTTLLVSDSMDGPGSCGQISPSRDVAARFLPGGTYYLEVSGTGGTAAYLLTARVLAPGCGDGVLATGEACDDGNSAAGDGCSNSCSFEGSGELEPNGTTATATPLISTATLSASMRGVISDVNDVDVFRIEVPAGHHLIAEISDGHGGCANAGALRLRSATGSNLVSDTTDGPDDCARIAAGLDTAARGLSAGTYYLEVTGTGNGVYVLDARVVAPSICGNLFLDAGELCDDGDTVSGDGCASTCQLESSEVEANNGAAAATALGGRMIGGALTAADEDWFAITLPSNTSVRARVHGGAIDQCPTGADSILELYQADGTTMIASDDDGGPGYCSTLEASETRGLAAGTYYLRVRPYGSQTFSYGLSIELVARPLAQ
ncbi:MAG: pre-peptidase C-terminal domain-containing protein [Deltaproteobacteria bacterium]|nr:pre-peptidase C-terminal domain-containing protein [Deltaproteobacteria bacterium]